MREQIDIITAPAYVSLAEGLDGVASSLSGWLASRNLGVRNLLWARVYMSDPANQLEELRLHRLYTAMLSQCAFSYVGQPLLNGAKMAVLFSVCPDCEVRMAGTPDRATVECHGAKILMHSVRLTADEARGLTPCEQTELIFARHIDWLGEQGMTLKDNCVRTWLYVRDIDRNYGEVMKGRNAVFGREGLTVDTHFIASTGIGGYMENSEAVIAIDFLSVASENMAQQYLNALEYLNPTHEYGVAFERGVKLSLPDMERVFVSGTASIDKYGQCLHVGDAARQMDRLFLNIGQLLKPARRTLADVAYMIVYLRDIADCRLADEYMQAHFPAVPCLVVEASVCRPQWLVEVECITY